MRGASYSLKEVADLLGVSKRTLQRRIREGAFPGRFLAPGPHGLELRIPAEDVKTALESVRPDERPLPTVVPSRYATPNEEESDALDLETLRDAVLAIAREDRSQLIAALETALAARDQEIVALRQEITRLAELIRMLLEQRQDRALPRTVEDPLAELVALEGLVRSLIH
ncbi:MAG: helix-turn-helix domain-containing protein [Myxococcota bacterium]